MVERNENTGNERNADRKLAIALLGVVAAMYGAIGYVVYLAIA